MPVSIEILGICKYIQKEKKQTPPPACAGANDDRCPLRLIAEYITKFKPVGLLPFWEGLPAPVLNDIEIASPKSNGQGEEVTCTIFGDLEDLNPGSASICYLPELLTPNP